MIGFYWRFIVFIDLVLLLIIFSNCSGRVSSALDLIKRHEVYSHGRLIDRVEAARSVAATNASYPQSLIQNLNEMAVGGGSGTIGGTSTFVHAWAHHTILHRVEGLLSLPIFIMNIYYEYLFYLGEAP